MPGYDGKRGWGGHCLPKDISALCELARSVDVKPNMFESIRSINEAHRGENPDFEKVDE